LVASTNLQAELFASQPDSDLAGRDKPEKLSRAMDKIITVSDAIAFSLA
jgi:hypothetical protein